MKNFVESSFFHKFIMLVILINTITLGLNTSQWILARTGNLLELIDAGCLFVFIIEMILKLIVYRLDFFKHGWNIFDFVIIGLCVVSSVGALSSFRTIRLFRILRSFRALRALRIVSGLKQLRIIMDALVTSIPGMFWSGMLLLLIYYIYAIMSVTFFGKTFPSWFGSIPKAMYTLFQLMTFESWSQGLVRPIMHTFPLAWAFFIPFMLLTAFVVMNLVVGILVNSIRDAAERMNRQDIRDRLTDENRELGSIKEEIRLVREHLQHLEDLLDDEDKKE